MRGGGEEPSPTQEKTFSGNQKFILNQSFHLASDEVCNKITREYYNLCFLIYYF